MSNWRQDSKVFDFPESFTRNYERMERELKVYIYRDRDPGAYFQSPRELKGLYGSEAYFFKNIKESRFLTTDPLQAHLFFIPISWHQMRTQGTRYENMTVIVEKYVERLISKYPYWNRTQGADHFFVICHDNGVEVAEGVPLLKENSIRLVCPASYDSHYIPDNDIALPQLKQSFSCCSPNGGNALRNNRAATMERLWKDESERVWNDTVEGAPTMERLWKGESKRVWNDTAEGYLLVDDKIHKTKFCICPLGFPPNTAFIADSIRYGCVPVIFTSYTDFPFNDILHWNKFSIVLDEKDVYKVKHILNGIRDADFSTLQNNLLKVQKLFEWNSPPLRFDAFHMVMYHLWLWL
ncbi:probable glycosyltransferase At5g03795 [Corylus avellana]|uniref:probable glycosyltransferase At5g03795 n=1 Tax=Corylus avellana TaxID=13451 RepID=UPI00286B6886|nr:probable glycosyltransferase At5g03795 [Corylus avellana]